MTKLVRTVSVGKFLKKTASRANLPPKSIEIRMVLSGSSSSLAAMESKPPEKQRPVLPPLTVGTSLVMERAAEPTDSWHWQNWLRKSTHWAGSGWSTLIWSKDFPEIIASVAVSVFAVMTIGRENSKKQRKLFSSLRTSKLRRVLFVSSKLAYETATMESSIQNQSVDKSIARTGPRRHGAY